MLTSKVIVVIFALIGNLARCSCWDRATNERYFDGAVFVRHKSVLKTDIIRKMKIISEIKCSQACLSENSCVAHTYCRTPSSPDKGTCYLHQNGIPEGEASVLDKNDECIYQQYIGFIEATCTRQCNNKGKCFYDYSNKRYSCRCIPPHFGTYCEKAQAISFRFTSLGKQGNSGPTSTSGYANTTLHGKVTLDKGMQIWTVPFSAFYILTLAGASGGNASQHGGHGAVLSGILKLNKGTRLRILIGQRGVKGTTAAGGGGGTFITEENYKLLAAAGGGGGGGGHIISKAGENGQANENGSVFGGINGLGGIVTGTEQNSAGAGGGFYGNGSCCLFITSINTCVSHKCQQGGLSFMNGGFGGTGDGNGGLGGGGAASNYFGGGGGGYSGGGVYATSLGSQAGGGGSYFIGDVRSISGQNNGDGYVLLELKSSSN